MSEIPKEHYTYKYKTTATTIFIEVKEKLLKLQEDYPDIKITYFASDAIEQAIEKERSRREIMRG